MRVGRVVLVQGLLDIVSSLLWYFIILSNKKCGPYEMRQFYQHNLGSKMMNKYLSSFNGLVNNAANGLIIVFV